MVEPHICLTRVRRGSIIKFVEYALMASVEPFQFEPQRQGDSEEEISQPEGNEDPRQEEARVGNNEWCQCGNCLPMSTEIESVCCKELNFIAAAIHGITEPHDKNMNRIIISDITILLWSRYFYRHAMHHSASEL